MYVYLFGYSNTQAAQEPLRTESINWERGVDDSDSDAEMPLELNRKPWGPNCGFPRIVGGPILLSLYGGSYCSGPRLGAPDSWKLPDVGSEAQGDGLIPDCRRGRLWPL